MARLVQGQVLDTMWSRYGSPRTHTAIPRGPKGVPTQGHVNYRKTLLHLCHDWGSQTGAVPGEVWGLHRGSLQSLTVVLWASLCSSTGKGRSRESETLLKKNLKPFFLGNIFLWRLMTQSLWNSSFLLQYSEEDLGGIFSQVYFILKKFISQK